jgi:hypothetical protein
MKKIRMLSIFFGFVLLGSVVLTAASEPVVRPVSIDVSLEKMRPDERGTDVRNIYTVTIDDTDTEEASDETYRIIYYLDDRFVEDFENQSLPFSFTRNFKGQKTGFHEIQIDLEDKEEIIVARGTVTVRVKR